MANSQHFAIILSLTLKLKLIALTIVEINVSRNILFQVSFSSFLNSTLFLLQWMTKIHLQIQLKNCIIFFFRRVVGCRVIVARRTSTILKYGEFHNE